MAEEKSLKDTMGTTGEKKENMTIKNAIENDRLDLAVSLAIQNVEEFANLSEDNKIKLCLFAIKKDIPNAFEFMISPKAHYYHHYFLTKFSDNFLQEAVNHNSFRIATDLLLWEFANFALLNPDSQKEQFVSYLIEEGKLGIALDNIMVFINRNQQKIDITYFEKILGLELLAEDIDINTDEAIDLSWAQHDVLKWALKSWSSMLNEVENEDEYKEEVNNCLENYSFASKFAKECFKQNADFDDIENGRENLLMWASIANDSVLVQDLFKGDKKPNISYDDGRGLTPRKLAVSFGHNDVVETLDKYDANNLREETAAPPSEPKSGDLEGELAPAQSTSRTAPVDQVTSIYEPSSWLTFYPKEIQPGPNTFLHAQNLNLSEDIRETSETGLPPSSSTSPKS